MPKKALITGITGQDGSYLAEHLLDEGYEVHGLVRPTTNPDRSGIRHLCQNPAIFGHRLRLHPGDVLEPASLRRAMLEAAPDELYHLAGQSHVGLSFQLPEFTCGANALGTLRLLEMLRDLPCPPRLFLACSAEIFGRPTTAPQDETTPVAPVTPYGCVMAFGMHLARVYRDAYALFVCCGILFNHESPRRAETFVTRKICRAAAAIKRGRQSALFLGDLDAQRDWGHARDVVRAMRLMLQQPRAADYVVASGELHSVREVVQIAFDQVQLDWRSVVQHDPALLRPSEPSRLVGNPARAQRELGWRPEISFEALIREMTEAELRALDD